MTTDIADLVRVLRADLLLQLVLATLLGGIVGLERELKGKPAGLRTNILICIGATTFTHLSVSLGHGDPGRIAAQVLTGVGFIGAGTILHTRGAVTGLTSAATIWVVSAIGMALGMGLYYEAIGTTALVMAVLLGLERVEVALVLVVLTGSGGGKILSLLRSQMRRTADEGGDGRNLFVLVVDAERGHARGTQAVLDHPEELGVGVPLQGTVDGRRRRVHALRELDRLDAGSPVTRQAVLHVVLAAASEGSGVGRKRDLKAIAAAPDGLELRRHGNAVHEVGGSRRGHGQAARVHEEGARAPRDQEHDEDREEELGHGLRSSGRPPAPSPPPPTCAGRRARNR